MPVEGKRIFVFNRKMLVEGIEPQKVKLLPYEVPKPELLGGRNAIWMNMLSATLNGFSSLCLDSPRSFSMNQDVSSSFLVSMLSYEALFRKILKRSIDCSFNT